ncbi:MAG: CopG family transcriptional regulator [Halobacteriota archaeon]
MPSMPPDEMVTLKVTKRTLERLERSARRNETLNDLINRLIDEHDKHRVEERERIQETWEDIHE